MDPEERKIAALIAAFDQEHARAERAITALSRLGEQLQGEVREAASAAVEAALRSLREEIANAQRALQELQRHSLWRATWQHLMVAFTAIAMTLLAVWWYVPTVAEMNQLRAERAQLQASIEELNTRGARIQLKECGSRGQRKRLCVLVDAAAGRFGNPRRGSVYMIAEGY